MTALPRLPSAQRARRARSTARGPQPAVEVLLCGSPDRGDDGAPLAAEAQLRDRLSDDVRVRFVGQLDIDDLLAAPVGAGVVIVDAASGIPAGQIVDLPLSGLIGRDDGMRPRSSHALSFPEVIGLADMLRGHPLRGRIIAIGGKTFGLGAALSSRVAKAIPALVAAVVDATERVRG